MPGTAPSTVARQLEEKGYIHAPGMLPPMLVESLRMRAHATLFREKQEARDAVKSNGSLIHLSDNPEYADIVGLKDIELLLRDCGATDPRWTADPGMRRGCDACAACDDWCTRGDCTRQKSSPPRR